MRIELAPIAFVENERNQVIDDNWGSVVSTIKLADHIPSEAFDGIDQFSHLEIIFYMAKVSDEKAVAQARHPRNDASLPRVGTFAQRNKNRPNKLGLTTVEFVERKERLLIVKNLDAISGSPILDIKPVIPAFQPKGEIIAPAWTELIMKNYWHQ